MDKTFPKFSNSVDLFSASKRYLAGGVSSAMRAACRPVPLFFTSGSGSQLLDVDGNRYIDYTLAWGPLILGHSHESIVSAVEAQLRRCQALGAQSELELRVAKRICDMVPCAERVAFSNTGTEAVQVAFRLARAYTGKRKIIRFEGHYHGWLDDVLIGYRPKSKISTNAVDGKDHGASSSPDMIVLEWNNLASVEALLRERHDETAAIITEPILCNSSCLMPKKGYLAGLRKLADKYGVLLIFDEVITGFRVARGGAQEFFGVKPDLATFGKAVAGGFPLSVVAGKESIMSLIEHQKVVHAGTFNGNPISLAAANATLAILDADSGKVLAEIEEKGAQIIAGIMQSAARVGLPVLVNGVGSAFHVSFTQRQEMLTYQDTLQVSLAARDLFIESMLMSGIYLLPDGRWYMSEAHTHADIQSTLASTAEVFTKNVLLLSSERSSEEIPLLTKTLQRS